MLRGLATVNGKREPLPTNDHLYDFSFPIPQVLEFFHNLYQTFPVCAFSSPAKSDNSPSVRCLSKVVGVRISICATSWNCRCLPFCLGPCPTTLGDLGMFLWLRAIYSKQANTVPHFERVELADRPNKTWPLAANQIGFFWSAASLSSNPRVVSSFSWSRTSHAWTEYQTQGLLARWRRQTRLTNGQKHDVFSPLQVHAPVGEYQWNDTLIATLKPFESTEETLSWKC